MAETKSLHKRLQEARAEFTKKNIKKSGVNKFSNYTYFTLDDILPTANEIFNKLEITPVFNLVIEDGLEYATLYLYDSNDDSKFILFKSHTADGEKKGSLPIQTLGGIHTYMKRYLYMNALEIAEPDLFDNLDNKDEEPRFKSEPKKVQNLDLPPLPTPTKTTEKKAAEPVEMPKVVSEDVKPSTKEQQISLIDLFKKGEDYVQAINVMRGGKKFTELSFSEAEFIIKECKKLGGDE